MRVLPPLGERFVAHQIVADEAVWSVGMDLILRQAKSDFIRMLERNREAVVMFDHTLRQEVREHHIFNRYAVTTEAIVIRAQLALEAPKEDSNGK
ncbi:hypothetical protein SEA_SYDNAT_38 [Mycobacterium phage SydNat]|uniref:Uncharacterized protein n=1 Tax=Mycobacterium phage Zolita TaxID=2593355 RepID=A0A514U2E7_9CAUD|nr:hypothetical protein KIP50_gp54 [Mycobacterium phage Zolita]QDK03122.1 hypothetical protein SEA_ZOLITA_37 [Mycobacterium phage Zolita]UVK64258.1 hypothetical protein SEA_SYDNAT_38 [Mycobacterium phage SydNat]UVK64344.1 hypothetical protein SEA_GHOULBOY_38 [Mycobacterium phage Ghoulboy]